MANLGYLVTDSDDGRETNNSQVACVYVCYELALAFQRWLQLHRK